MGLFHDDLGTYEMPSMALASQTLARFFMTIFGTVRICDLPLQRMSVAPALPAPGVVLVDGWARPPRHSCSIPLGCKFGLENNPHCAWIAVQSTFLGPTCPTFRSNVRIRRGDFEQCWSHHSHQSG